MTVVVVHRDTGGDTHLGEAALNAAEMGERQAVHPFGKAHLAADGDGGEGVLHIVGAEHRQAHPFHSASALADVAGDHHVKSGAQRVSREVDRPHVGLRAHAIDHDTPAFDAPDQSLHLGVVDAERGNAVEGDVLDEGLIGPPH